MYWLTFAILFKSHYTPFVSILNISKNVTDTDPVWSSLFVFLSNLTARRSAKQFIDWLKWPNNKHSFLSPHNESLLRSLNLNFQLSRNSSLNDINLIWSNSNWFLYLILCKNFNFNLCESRRWTKYQKICLSGLGSTSIIINYYHQFSSIKRNDVHFTPKLYYKIAKKKK